MILYKGKIYENSMQNKLIENLRGDLYNPIKNGGSLQRKAVISACDSLAQRVKAGDFDEIVKPFLELYNIGKTQFEDMIALFDRESLNYKCSVELCDEDAVIGGKVLRKRYPLGVLLHIAAGNVDILPAYSVIEGLLSGNINILKLPAGDSGLSVKLLYELIKIEPALTDYVYVFDVPSTETETLKTLADLCDGVIVWGGDGAVKAARKLAEPDTKIIEWGHKLSFAYAEPDAEDGQLEALAKSICETNQLLCSSCQGIFVDTDSKQVQDEFAKRFFEILKKVSNRMLPVDYGMKAKNAVNIYNERLERHITGRRIFSENGVSVIAADDSKLELSYLYRSVWVKRLPLDRLYTIKKYKRRLQTAAVLANDPEKQNKIRDILAQAGVVRITSAGNMSRTICGEAHDGAYALREYSRFVETEIF